MKTTLVSKLKNWWWYYNKVILLAIAALAVCLYMYSVNRNAEEADYHVGIVSAIPLQQEEITRLETAICAAGEDRNQDGQVLVTVHTYYVDLTDDDPNAGYKNYEIVTALDADLIGRTSGIFLLDDPAAFRSITNGILAQREFSWPGGLTVAIRNDADPADAAMFDALHDSLTTPIS